MDENFSAIIDRFSDLKVVVVGEAILESYIKGSANRLTLEAPAPVVEVAETQDVPGGAASAAVNARSLGAEVTFLSVIGKDMEGESLLQQLRAREIGVSDVLRRPDRRSLLRRRIYADGRLMVRYDQGSSGPVGSQSEDLLLEQLRHHCLDADVIILSDYGAGVITPRLVEGIARLQSENGCVIVADTRRVEKFSGLQLAAIRPSSQSALEIVSNLRGNGHEDPAVLLGRLTQAGDVMLSALNTQMVAITLDDDGALVFERASQASSGEPDSAGLVYRTYARDMPFNRVDGAGDAFVAGLALSLAAGADAPMAAEVASAVASLVVRRGGMATCCSEDVRAYLAGEEKRVADRAVLAERIARYRQEGRRIVFTNGCFDILHSGHVAYLNQAKAFGDVLVIGVNNDESVSRLKGPERPINHLDDRMRVLAGLSSVDLLIPFEEDTPINLLEIVQPDFYVKGGDYSRETLPETPVVEGLGGEIRIIPYMENRSTSGVIQKIRGA
jgi:D-beta-D-heptose 7-phosphate kinase / D-beta-D-heptose 1-phosphate adenosyltransferase